MLISVGAKRLSIQGIEGEDIIVHSFGYFIYKDQFYVDNKLREFVRQSYVNQVFPAIIPSLSGCFQLTIIDKNSNRCLVVQDRWGSYPMFYHQSNDYLTFSTNSQSFYNSNLSLSINQQACAEMISFGHVMGNKTLVNEIHEFAPHHWFEISLQRDGFLLQSHDYWKLTYTFQKANFAEKSKAFADLWFEKMAIFADAIRQSGKCCYIPLSAGLDSRLLATAIDRENMPQINLTFGSGVESREIDIAGKVSRSLQHATGHYILYLNETNFLQITRNSPVTHRITTGHFAEKDLWYPHLIKRECDYMISGHSGDFMAGSHFKTRMKSWRKVDEVVEYIVKFKGTPLGRHLYFNNSEVKELLHSSLSSIIGGDYDLMNSFMRWDLEERQRRFIMRSVIAENPDQVPMVLMPFFDYELFDHFVDLPFEFLLNTELYRHSMVKHIYSQTPQFAKFKANGQPVYPLIGGVVREYWTKLNDYLNIGRNKNFAFAPDINWQTLTSQFVYPQEMPSEWIVPDYISTNSRLLYSLSEFTKRFNQRTQQ